MFALSIACMNFIQGNLVYFLNYRMLLPALFLPVAGGVMVLAVLFMPVWTAVSRRTSKRTAYILSIAVLCVALALMAFSPAFDYEAAGVVAHVAGDADLVPAYRGSVIRYIADVNADYGTVLSVLWRTMPWIYPVVVLLSLGFAGLQMIPFSIVPDAINFASGAGEREEGVYYGVVTFVQKLGWAVGMLLTGAVLNVAGYLEPAKAFTAEAQASILSGAIVLQSPAAVDAIAILFSVMPIAFGILGILSLLRYRVDRDALRRRVAEAAAAEAVR